MIPIRPLPAALAAALLLLGGGTVVAQIEGGPAILIIGDVVAHSAPWRASDLPQYISELLVAAE